MRIFSDFDTNVIRALTEIDPNWRSYPGIIICGTHTPQDIEQRLELIKKARKGGIPFLGICHGFQLAAIEFARNVQGIKDATSEEFGDGTHVVKKLPKLKVGLHKGESYWHNYEVDIDFEVPKNFFISQYHPEYQSRKSDPHPLLVKFLEYAKSV